MEEQLINRYYQRTESEKLKKIHEEQKKVMQKVFEEVHKAGGDQHENKCCNKI